ncbi:hypothetical protein ACXWTF_05525 [Thiomicrolovo sp. ZZH C-3]
MSKSMVEIKTLKLAHTQNGTISIAHIEEPYGKHSSPVVSIAIALEGASSDWKVHLPYENIDEVIKGLQEAKAANDGMPHHDKHTDDLNADTGGGA